jgi:hypothetical protein
LAVEERGKCAGRILTATNGCAIMVKHLASVVMQIREDEDATGVVIVTER